MHDAYKINAPQVASQVIDGEAILIHFDSGRYYTAEGAGGQILTWLEQRQPIERIIDALATQFGQPRETVVAAVGPFVGELLDEGLIVPDDGVGAAPELRPVAAGAAFLPLTLKKYTELEDLLRLDPIHDVDASGWPVAKS